MMGQPSTRTALGAEALAALRTCAFCPNPCRSRIPADLAGQLESQTPSALALLALTVVAGLAPAEASVRATLEDLAAARACRSACVYDFDIPALVLAVAAEVGR